MQLATIRNADKIVVMESGRIVEQGSHAELCHAQGHYWQLWQQQLNQANRTLHSGQAITPVVVQEDVHHEDVPSSST
eukprot:912266-Pyramimonas_sp.AAC.1